MPPLCGVRPILLLLLRPSSVLCFRDALIPHPVVVSFALRLPVMPLPLSSSVYALLSLCFRDTSGIPHPGHTFFVVLRLLPSSYYALSLAHVSSLHSYCFRWYYIYIWTFLHILCIFSILHRLRTYQNRSGI
ncbi:hypothetical protein R3P38DRAFT_3049543 [Favolaschia claudopus]|uniref:Secreted peptide n=1 Tax=Favolaschia claudopus TaxID=2862362 RepID=A0AAW0A6J7_9AGAR